MLSHSAGKAILVIWVFQVLGTNVIVDKSVKTPVAPVLLYWTLKSLGPSNAEYCCEDILTFLKPDVFTSTCQYLSGAGLGVLYTTSLVATEPDKIEVE